MMMNTEKWTKEEEDKYEKILYKLFDKVGRINVMLILPLLMIIDVNSWSFPQDLYKTDTFPELQHAMTCIEEDEDLKKFIQAHSK